MDIRYSANQRDVKRYTTQELRDEFLIQNLYAANEVVAVYFFLATCIQLFKSVYRLTQSYIFFNGHILQNCSDFLCMFTTVRLALCVCLLYT